MGEPDFGMGHFAHDLPGIPLHGFDPGHYPDGANAIRLDSPQNGILMVVLYRRRSSIAESLAK